MSIWKARVWAVEGAMPPPLSDVSDGAALSQAVKGALGGGQSPWATVEEAALGILRLEREGHVRLEMPVASARLARLRKLAHDLGEMLDEDPGLHNVVGDLRAWTEDPDHYDFVGTETELGVLKAFERDVYMTHLAPYLEQLGGDASWLDAGCGPGRFSEALAVRGHRVTMVDASAEAVRRAFAHALEAGQRADVLEAYVGEVQSLGMCADESFDGALAMEVICYQSSPLDSLKELTRVVRPGGLVAVSVEGRYGSLMAAPGYGDDFEARLAGERLERDGDVCVTYFTEASLRALCVEAGLVCEGIFGTHYLAEGPFASWMDGAALRDAGARDRLIALEMACDGDPVLRPLARAWLAVGRRPQ